jgi:hypothetical protein
VCVSSNENTIQCSRTNVDATQQSSSNHNATSLPSSLSDDEVLQYAVLNGLYHISMRGKNILRMTMANFYGNYVVPNRPPNTYINLKQTTYKKFSTYTNACKIVIENGNNNDNLLMVGPDPNHPKHGDPNALLLGFN